MRFNHVCDVTDVYQQQHFLLVKQSPLSFWIGSIENIKFKCLLENVFIYPLPMPYKQIINVMDN